MSDISVRTRASRGPNGWGVKPPQLGRRPARARPLSAKGGVGRVLGQMGAMKHLAVPPRHMLGQTGGAARYNP